MPVPSEEVLHELVARYAHLLAAHGEAFEGAELVTPTSAHFPDHFTRDGQSVAHLLARVVSYTPLGESVPLEVAIVETETGGTDDGHCTSGCSKPGSRIDGVQRVGSGYRLPLPVTETGHPVRLVCALARGVSAAVLVEAGEEVIPSEVGMTSEILAVLSGFGVVMLEASHVYTKSCGGPSIHQGTVLAPNELATLLAIFCAVNDIPARVARKHLGATQAEELDEAAAWVAAHEAIITKLREAPELLEGGAFTFETKRGFFSRFLSKPAVEAPASKRTKSADEVRRLAEARALVEEELG